ncbi:1-acyl-sn-glycerol-3-phosphate acyltransferase [Phragmitibacter flavus]|uniref:1-acyl-sn-glycerol-3-phosphate acyltransferase n=1 Tax=Phragmitibacter flavus TaxID=2576071 RepID=A0A5R8KCV8_9BACT|nr:lysophospholipid acyltransferase family protein [Phragmitibacter flavus]TLD69429.1 1-acyl-sn-glycerol-3-phosphate acyltransferase [Phragmitibacter flavus]
MKLAYWLGYTFFKTMARGFFDYSVVGKERLEIEGGALLVCNHASFLDPPFAGIALDQDIHFLARKSLMTNPMAKAVYKAWNSIPVDQDKPDMSSLKAVVRLLKQGEKVLVFPEGSRTADGNLQEGQPGVGLIVTKALVPVIPMRLFGTREALPMGGKFFQPSEITLVVGEPWFYDASKYREAGKELYAAISKELMAEVEKLGI